MKDRVVYIYGLIDPRNNELRYIGKTVNLKDRLYKHLNAAKTLTTDNHKNAWIRGLLNRDLKPIMKILAECTGDNWQDVERNWIAKYKKNNAKLLNITTGGEGVTGYIFTKEHREKISKANKGRKLNERHRNAL